MHRVSFTLTSPTTASVIPLQAAEQKRRDLQQRLAAKNAALDQKLLAIKVKAASNTAAQDIAPGEQPVCWVRFFTLCVRLSVPTRD